MSALRLIAKSLHRAGFADTSRTGQDFPVLAFADTKLCRLPRPPWLVWCRKPPFMVSPLMKHCKSSNGVSVEIPYLAITKHFLRSEMLDLTRFPVSDEFISDRKTFCTILDRKDFLDFFELLVFDKGHVTTEHMDMWRFRWRIQ